MKTRQEATVPLHQPLYHGARRLRVALIGMPNSGKSTLFKAVSSTSVQTGELAGTNRSYERCSVQVGLDEASLVDLPSVDSLYHRKHDDQVTMEYLLWGDQRPPVAAHEPGGPPAPFAPPDVIIQVVDGTFLEQNLELTLELSGLGRPIVIALNKMDEVWNKGINISSKALSRRLGVPVVPTVALQGHGISELFATAVEAVREQTSPLPQLVSDHIRQNLGPLSAALNRDDIHEAFRVPHPFLVLQLAAGDRYFLDEMQQHFPDVVPEIQDLRETAAEAFPRAVDDELHADRHHRAATLYETVSRLGSPHERHSWRYWLDELFLHPRLGLIGSLAVFATVLFMVFEVSVWIDSMTTARLIDAATGWQPQSTGGVIGRAVVDGLIGLAGIVVPYMIPLVLLLVALEEAGVMQRIAFVLDRGFHQIGLHGGVAVPFLLGLGCNVPAISAAASSARGHERVIASLLIVFVPCSARSAIILALAGKYLGGAGVFAIFMLTLVVIAMVGKLLTRRYPEGGPGQVQEIPELALPSAKVMVTETWVRTRDILTIVTPLLVGGSIVLALLNHFGADNVINAAFTPVTDWWLGLPAVLGVPILFGILRKELSLLMIYQALGTFDVDLYLDWVQLVTFLVFLTFYIPCVSTFAVMLRTIGRKEAFFSIALSIGVALIVSGIIRIPLEVLQHLA